MKDTNRRDFIKTTLAVGSLVLRCEQTEYDLLIKNGLVFDGLAHDPVQVDIGIRSERIVAMGSLHEHAARRLIDAAGLTVAPGFIDVHTHSDVTLLANPKAESKIRQGVTTEICGNCGDSPFPWDEEKSRDTIAAVSREYQLEANWRTLAGYWQRLEKNGVAVNVATLLGHSTLREAVMGADDRPPTTAELQRMQAILRECLQAGALGLSSGLEYKPGMYASTQELIALCRIVAEARGVYATHMRNEDKRVEEALAEALAIGAATGCKVQLSHLKACQKRNWYKTPLLLQTVEQARKNGIDVYADRYPYTAYSTSMKLLFPFWSRDGDNRDFLKCLASSEQWQKIKLFLQDKISALGSWDSVLVTRLASAERKEYQGKTVAQLAANRDPYQFVRELMIAEQGDVHMCGFAMSEEDTAAVLAFPYTLVGSDGDALAPYGVLSAGTPHPRCYGTFPRYLGLYVREKKLLPMAEAIRRITSLPCRHFSIPDRGELTIDKFADLVIFDSKLINDKATFVEPHQYPDGISYVIVNGKIVIEKGKHTGLLPGKILRRA